MRRSFSNGKDFERGARIRFARLNPTTRSAKLTQVELAELLDRPTSTIRGWEQGRRITDRDIRDIADYTGIDFEWIKTGKGLRPIEKLFVTIPPWRIRDIRIELGYTLSTFAAKLGVSRVTLWKWEEGTARPRAAQVEEMKRLYKSIQTTYQLKE